MKRKFSLNLAPVIPSKSDTNPSSSPEPVSSHSHRRHQSKDSLSSPSSPYFISPYLSSPYICRRPLSPKVEQELRSACALILQNLKPSDHGFADADPKLDFHAFTRRAEREHKAGTSQVKVHKPTGAPSEPRTAHDARKHSHKADGSSKDRRDARVQANTSRRRTEQPDVKSAATRSDMDSDDGKSLGTPLTGSSDAHLNNGSTAPTSAALTDGESSKRASHQFESAAAAADAQAAEWMRQELLKRHQRQGSQSNIQSQPEQRAPARPPSRSRSIRNEIREYIFPGSTSLSRTQSTESLRQMYNAPVQKDEELKRSGSNRGWRSWGLQRKSSQRGGGRPTSSTGRIENQEEERKQELNLNRELPPLPSLDSWNKPEKSEKRKSQAQGAHIATVMRSQDQQQQEYAAAVRRHHRRSGSDTLALRYATSSFAASAPQVAQTSSQKSGQNAPKLKRISVRDHSMDFDQMMSAMDSSNNFDDQLKFNVGKNSTAAQDFNSISRSPSTKMSSDHNRLAATTNFSRKISTEVAGSQRNPELLSGYQNEVHIGPNATTQKNEHKSRIRKVFSSWMLKKEKKENWMDHVEKNGVKGGVMVQDGAALPPVVRY